MHKSSLRTLIVAGVALIIGSVALADDPVLDQMQRNDAQRDRDKAANDAYWARQRRDREEKEQKERDERLRDYEQWKRLEKDKEQAARAREAYERRWHEDVKFALAVADQKMSKGYSSEALDILRWWTDKGDAETWYRVGIIYLTAPYSTGSALSEGEKLLRQAAGAGHTAAQISLGLYLADYDSGNEAFNLLQPAALQGSATACEGLSWLYLKGRGVPKDSAQAILWYIRGAGRDGVRIANEELSVREHLGKLPEAELAAGFALTGSTYEENEGSRDDRSREPGRMKKRRQTPQPSPERFGPDGKLAFECYAVAAELVPNAQYEAARDRTRNKLTDDERTEALKYLGDTHIYGGFHGIYVGTAKARADARAQAETKAKQARIDAEAKVQRERLEAEVRLRKELMGPYATWPEAYAGFAMTAARSDDANGVREAEAALQRVGEKLTELDLAEAHLIAAMSFKTRAWHDREVASAGRREFSW